MTSADPPPQQPPPHERLRPPAAGTLGDEGPSTVDALLRSSKTMLFFRTVGAIAVAAVACLVPEVGPHRFWLAATLIFVCVPLATWLELRFPASENGWSEPLFDLSMVILLVHLVPAMWFTALVIGLIVVQAPSVAESERSYFYYALFATMLTAGMTFAAIVHSVEGWQLPILSMTVLYPSVIYYSYRQTAHANELRDRAISLEGLRRVAGGVAHDFNNLLTSVLGNAELASLELDESHPASEPLADVVNGATRASMLTSRLLALSGRPGHGIAEFDLEEEIHELVGLLEPVLPPGVRVRVDSSLEGGQRVRADRAKLQQLAMNLIINASEALERRPHDVFITLQRSDDRRGERVSILVSDQGVGIRAEDRERIFDPFFSSKERGHGLGLSQAREIAQELGGELAIRSTPGYGTDARLEIPTVAPAGAPPARRAVTPSTRQSDRLALVVDDEAEVRQVASRMLSRLEFQAIEAEDGFRGVELFAERADAIALVVLDVRMPGMSGWQCLQRIRAIRDDVPVIVCSGYDPREQENGLEADGVVRLTKPFRIADLRAATAAIAAAQTPVAR